jgi:hypothetical protein
MKLSEVAVGQRYLAKVSGRLQAVRILELRQVPPHGWSSRSAWRTLILAVNEATGRRLTIRSSQRLRPLIARGCEFCRQTFNRPAGEFTCPYCQERWNSVEA